MFVEKEICFSSVFGFHIYWNSFPQVKVMVWLTTYKPDGFVIVIVILE